MNPTKLVYLEDFNLFSCPALVVSSYAEQTTPEQEKQVVVLDQTVFYPQGGGQPYDTGVIESASGKFMVKEVRFVDGIVKHIGIFDQGGFATNEQVRCSVDADRRALHTKLHSAGHVIDMVAARLKLPWTPGKGFHFPEGPYVEYTGDLTGVDSEQLKATFAKMANEILSEGLTTKLLFMPKSEMASVVRFVPENLPENKPARVVMYGDFGVPCGGTHVNVLADIGSIMIRKLKMEKGNIRVSYAVA